MSLAGRVSQSPKIHLSVLYTHWQNLDRQLPSLRSVYRYLRRHGYDKARQALRTVLEKTSRHGCVVEIIMKDISTLRYAPQRLWQWAEIAREEASRWA